MENQTNSLRNNMTLDRYKEFMNLARRQDLQHHGQHTF